MLNKEEYDGFLTEQLNEKSINIDKMSTLNIVTLINNEDKTVAFAVEKELENIALAVDKITERLQLGGRLFYIGAGTSGRLGIIDAAECPPTYGVSSELIQGIIAGGNDAVFAAAENVEDDGTASVKMMKERGFCEKDVCFGISASGSAQFVNSALEFARSIGALDILLCCNPQAPERSNVTAAITPEVGAEVICGSTRMKAATAQKMVLTSISTAVMIKLGRVSGNRMIYLKPGNRKLIARSVRMICEMTGIDEVTAERILREESFSVDKSVLKIKNINKE